MSVDCPDFLMGLYLGLLFTCWAGSGKQTRLLCGPGKAGNLEQNSTSASFDFLDQIQNDDLPGRWRGASVVLQNSWLRF